MRLHTLLRFIALAVALALTACGDKAAPPSPAAEESTLYVRAAGMVKSLGIT